MTLHFSFLHFSKKSEKLQKPFARLWEKMVLKLDFSDDYLYNNYTFGSDDDDEDLCIQQWLDYQEEEEEDLRRRKKRNTGRRPGGTNSTGRPDYWGSEWGRMLQNPELQVLGSPLRRVFRRRFRVPYPIFLRLVQWAKGGMSRMNVTAPVVKDAQQN